MSKHLIKVLTIVLLMVFMAGCSNSVNKTPSEGLNTKQAEQVLPQPPEPYTKALEELNKPDFDMALRYLDLAIKDFPDNPEYLYKAHLLRCAIYNVYYQADIMVMEDIVKGAQKGRSLISSNYFNRITAYVEKTSEIPWNKDYLLSIQYVMANYNDTNKSFNVPLVKTPAEQAINPDYKSVDWFAKVGSPTPLDSEIDGARKYWRRLGWYGEFDITFKDGKINYPFFFYKAGKTAYEFDEGTSKALMQKVLDITQDDKYNEYRILAEKQLTNFK